MTCLWSFIPLLLMVVISGSMSEPHSFDPFISPETSYFSPQEDEALGTFSGYSYNPAGGVQLRPHFRAHGSETSNIPTYTDGKATPPQRTLSKLEKDYKATLHRLANSEPGTIVTRQRVIKFVSEPQASASTIDERKPFSSPVRQPKEIDRPTLFLPQKSQTVELHTGFVPIINGVRQEKRGSKSLASTVIKDIEPPILTAAPASLTARPNLLTVSASVRSSAKIPPNGQRTASSSVVTNDIRARPRPGSFSRFLNFPNDTNTVISVSSSTSESIVPRGALRSESILDLQQKDLLRVSPPSESVTFEQTRQTARKIIDINCEGSHDLGWCELGDKYPKKYVNEVISSCRDVIERMHVEVPHSFEKLSDTSDFKAELDNSSRRSAKERGSHDAWSWAAYFHQGSLCDAETGFLRPETAIDSSGKWNIIVQTDRIKQRVPIEMCRKTNGSCKKMLNCGLKSQCLQKYNYHLLLSLNPTQKPTDCPFMKLYRFPSACVCHVECTNIRSVSTNCCRAQTEKRAETK